MAKLTKFVYGNEISRKKTPFGLLNNQKSHDSIIHNAGWFNSLGQKLGTGDLTIREMADIQARIAVDELFFVLSEANTLWHIPPQFDKSEPGACYCVEYATWIIGHNIGIVRVRDDILKSSETILDGVRYARIPNNVVINTFKTLLSAKHAASLPSSTSDQLPNGVSKTTAKSKKSSWTGYLTGQSAKPKPTP